MTAGLLRAWPLPQSDDGDDKNARGRVVIAGGSAEVPGSVLLAGVGALRAGAGKLQLAVSASVATAMAIAVPEARVVALPETSGGAAAGREAGKIVADLAAGAQAVVLGPGMAKPDEVRLVLEALIACCADAGDDAPVVIVDAAAIDSLAGEAAGLLAPLRGRVVLTPNAAEAAFLLGLDVVDVTADALARARSMAADQHGVVALKGATTYTVGIDGTAFADGAGNVGLATSGAGDVLAGVIGGLAARGADALQAAVWGVHLHAVAADRLAARIAPVGYLARELLDEVPLALAWLERPAD